MANKRLSDRFVKVIIKKQPNLLSQVATQARRVAVCFYLIKTNGDRDAIGGRSLRGTPRDLLNKSKRKCVAVWGSVGLGLDCVNASNDAEDGAVQENENP